MSQIYSVVINHEEQYSVWPADQIRSLPKGWTDTGKQADKAACRQYIEQVWTDMRPLSKVQRVTKHDQMERLITTAK